MIETMLNRVSRVSRLLQPVITIPKGGNVKTTGSSKSYQLMLDLGIIRQSNTGMYSLLPLGLRALEKLIRIVDNEMTNIGGQKLLLPNLTDEKLWKKTGRLVQMKEELFTVTDRHEQRYLLSPTYEEAITSLIADVKPQKNNLPLLLYQISNKWRDEMKPRLGLFRGREFIMKDMYSFDLSLESAQESYQAVGEAYNKIFDQLEVPYFRVEGDTGVMGGLMSHEYHYHADIGEDTLVACEKCNFRANSVVYDGDVCKECGGAVAKNSAIEIGHTFLLGTKYSKVLKATVHSQDKKIPMVMGCYGLGLTRILAATLEILSTDASIRWPKLLAPYTVCVIPPKENSKESPAAHYADDILRNLIEKNVDVILDDRTELTIGRRLLDAQRTGYPYVIVIGRCSMQEQPLFELHEVNEGQRQDFSLDQLYNFFEQTDYRDVRTKSQIKL